MKRLFLGICLLIGITANAQIGATAPDFTVTDLNGNDHTLYNYLDEGYVVILDVSATWCGPCWSFHSTHALQMMHEQYGEEGTNQVRVMFYEADASTTLADLEGTGGNTQGDWLDGSTYPFINEAPITLPMNIYAPLGFPTVNIIRPSDYQIVADPWNGDFDDVVDAVNNNTDITLGEVSSVDENESSLEVSVYPNPATDVVFIDLSAAAIEVDAILITDALGRSVSNVGINDVLTSIDVSALSEGAYLINLLYNNETVGVKKFFK